MSKSNEIFAVFAVAALGGGMFAATTRAADRGELGKIGLPGGKVDAGESPEAALYRECSEEGWDISMVGEMVHSQIVDGKLVAWFSVEFAEILPIWKEADRVCPVVVHESELHESGFGNENVFRPLCREILE